MRHSENPGAASAPSSESTQGLRLAVDIGGTFTDVVLEEGAQRWTHKLLTTPARPEQALIEGARAVLAKAGRTGAEIAVFAHGTTLATNAILERRGARTALLTTEGFRDVLEMGREGRHDLTDLSIKKPVPLVERALRLTVTERMDANGDVLAPLDEAAVLAVAERLRVLEVESLAIGFLHSYVNPAHELRAAQLIRSVCPDLSISLSSEVCRQMGEYERMSTVVANAYVQPIVSAYLTRLTGLLEAEGIVCPLLLMFSTGGLSPAAIAHKEAVRLVESGPAGGAVLAASIAREKDIAHVVAFDMGGTTAKVCFIHGGTPAESDIFEVDRQEGYMRGSGLPLRTPVVNLVEIGAGGGSILGVNAMGLLTAGPKSASSDPGPACYGRGGQEPTVTDADLVLGRIEPSRFAGGLLGLSEDAAAAALDRAVGSVLGASPQGAAHAANEIVDEMMANAARAHAAELGLALSDHVMIAFGGAAPLHALRLAEKLGVDQVIIPHGAGVGSAIGFLRAPTIFTRVVSRAIDLDTYEPGRISGLLGEMHDDLAQQAATVAERDGFVTAILCKARYRGQGATIEFALDGFAPERDALRATFEAEYDRLYGRVLADAPIELIAWQVRLTRENWHPSASRTVSASPAAAPAGTRRVLEASDGAFRDYAVVERNGIGMDGGFAGPALIVEDQTTTVMPSSFGVAVDAFGHLNITRIAAGVA